MPRKKNDKINPVKGVKKNNNLCSVNIKVIARRSVIAKMLNKFWTVVIPERLPMKDLHDFDIKVTKIKEKERHEKK